MPNRDLVQDITIELETDNARLDRNALVNIKQNAEAGYYSTVPRENLITDLKAAGAEQLAQRAGLEEYVIDQADRRDDYETKQAATAPTDPPPPPPIDGEFEDEATQPAVPPPPPSVPSDNPQPAAG